MPPLESFACDSSGQVIHDLDVVAITCPAGIEHLIQDAVFVEHADDGWYPARCGKWVCSASLCVPAGERCCRCEPAWACAS